MTKVRLSHIPEEGALIETGIKLSLDELGLKWPWSDQGIELDYELRNVHGKILGNFKARGRMGLECSRCLEFFEQDAQASFMLEFEKQAENFNPRHDPDPEDPGLNVVVFSGDEIEFGEDTRQELELLVPFAPLCRPDCKGLCPVCGGNLNERDCGCEAPKKDSPFSGLNQLFQKNKEN